MTDQVPENTAATTADETDAATSPADDQTSLEEQLAALHQRLAETERSLSEADLRTQAEIQNIRRRAERDVANAHKYALEKFAADILGVADSLERGLAALNPDDEQLKSAREGVELTLKVLLDVFGRFNIQPVDPRGETFNAERHEAMAMIPHPQAPANQVIEVLEKGYLLNGRLIRPARVVVAKAQ